MPEKLLPIGGIAGVVVWRCLSVDALVAQWQPTVWATGHPGWIFFSRILLVVKTNSLAMGGIRSFCQRQQVLPFQDGAAFDADETTALLWSKQEWFLPDVGRWS